MTPLERAETYAAIFLHVEEDWPSFLPIDAIREGDTVWLRGVRMERGTDGWRLTEVGA
jgi:hypothetical protein